MPPKSRQFSSIGVLDALQPGELKGGVVPLRGGRLRVFELPCSAPRRTTLPSAAEASPARNRQSQPFTSARFVSFQAAAIPA